ncbi:interleukin-31 receptor subunit alpha isoform X2 [Denticeps clupeoides]|uniref:interleukin-31 receptor subunit alpha isoform X2 n=1 Tax=Denticeps clupeoides TaxID=299321 RepID=UPI0010A3A454|nr:interleukin-31 receptor subunit alpha-like isoform X2 [Denticeps clupeoides]
MNQLVRFLIQAGPERTRRGATMMGWISTGLVLLVVRLFQASDPELCRRPTIQYCVFLEHANVTCHWEPVGQPFSTTYTLQVNITSSLGGRTFKALEPCVTTETHCSVNIESVIHEYSMDVLARNSHGVSRSPRHDVYGLNEVKLYPPTFTNLARVPGKPKCLDLSWGRPQSFALSKPEVERGCLIFQLEFYSSGENHSQVIERNISGFDIELCIFRPGTEYRVRMRYQYINANRHWSDWTTYQSSSTDEAAPSAAPQAWWLIGSSDERGWRDFTLMWKPLPASVANGYVLWYKVQCWQDQDQDGHDVENCGTVNHSSYSCKLSLPPESCTCSLTASNSAGTSPEANVRIPASIESTGSTMSLSGLHVIPLDDHRMEVTWTVYDTRTDQTGFIIQWFPVSQGQMDNLYWEWQNPAARGLVITDGIHPEVPYDVSVRELHGATAGLQLSVVVFTRQGEPSAGPALQVQELGEGSVTLQWQQLKIAELRGFLRNYTLTYINANGQAKYVTLPGTFTQYTLRGLSGEYRVYITAHTDAGASPGPSVTVLVGSTLELKGSCVQKFLTHQKALCLPGFQTSLSRMT